MTVLLYPSQTPTGRSLVMMNNRIEVLSECCQSVIEIHADIAECGKCEDIVLKPCEFSSGFPVTAFKMARPHGYWYDWGFMWFGWKEFSFETEWS